jgi:hypothetical protein
MGLSALHRFCREIIETDNPRSTRSDRRVFLEAAAKLILEDAWYYHDMFGTKKDPPSLAEVRKFLLQIRHILHSNEVPPIIGHQIVVQLVESGIIEPHLIFPCDRFGRIFSEEESKYFERLYAHCDNLNQNPPFC